MNTYETVFIMNPVLSDEQIKETVKKFVGYIKKKKGTVSHEENWGLKKLKYSIQKKKTGFYYLIEFEASGNIIKDLKLNSKEKKELLDGKQLSLKSMQKNMLKQEKETKYK